jgi:hypothetical protein
MNYKNIAPFDRRRRMPYPTDHTTCFISKFGDVERLLQDLEENKIDMAHVDLLYGQEGLEMIDLKGDSHSFLDKFVRMAQRFWGSGEWIFFEIADEEIREGHYLVAVATKDEALKEKVVELMQNHNAHDIKYFNSMFVEHFSRKNLYDFDKDKAAQF